MSPRATGATATVGTAASGARVSACEREQAAAPPTASDTPTNTTIPFIAKTPAGTTDPATRVNDVTEWD
jgi:hypothetical protein